MDCRCGRGGGGRRRLRHVVPLVLIWIFLLRSALGCSSTNCNLVLTEAQGGFSSPCYPQKYPNSKTCRWSVQAPAGFIVQLSFLDFELEEAQGCIYDRVVVSTGSAEVRLCGLTASGLTLNSTGNLMELTFTSDFSIQKRGFRVSFQHVAVELRNQKVTVTGGGRITRVSESISIPPLSELTVCWEVERSSYKEKEWIFSYYDSNGTIGLAFGTDGTGMQLVVGGAICPLDAVSSADFTSSMRLFCVVWSSSGGQTAVYFGGTYRNQTCPSSGSRAVAGGGLFQLGAQHSFGGNVYNLRLWNHAMTLPELRALTCDAVGSVVDWDNSHWSIPSALAQTDSTLSCSSDAVLATGCDVPGSGCPDGLFYRVSFVVDSQLGRQAVEGGVAFWLNQTFQNWTHVLDDLSIQPATPAAGTPTSYTCQALLLVSNESLGEAGVLAQLSGGRVPPASGLQVRPASISVQLIDNCPSEHLLHYRWPETRPRVTQNLPCFPNKDQSASRTCLIAPGTFSSRWAPANATSCAVTAENAAGVAEQLANFSRNNLSSAEVSQVVTKVQELVGVARIDTAVAEAVLHIISNVMVGAETPPLDASNRALRAVEQLAQRVEFPGPSINISSRNLALGVLALNTSTFNGTAFSAFVPPNATDPKIEFEPTANPLAQVTLPPSLLSGVSLDHVDVSSLSRINFLFFSSTNLFKRDQDSLSLSSYVVASSVGNVSIRDLRDPVKIEVAHLQEQTSSHRVCVFWDFSLDGGDGGWSRRGCSESSESSGNRTVCLCNHLTHFAILMDVSQTSSRIDPEDRKVLTFLSYIGCGVSAVCSAATLLTYVAFEKLRRDYPSKILMNLSASLLLLNLVFLLNGWLAGLADSPGLCLSAAALLHYLLLTSFTWMALESVHMYIALVKVFNTYIRRYILKFCLVGWGLPAVLVGVVVSVDRNHYGVLEDGGDEAAKMCWIRDAGVFYGSCVGFFVLVFLLNVAMFIVVMMQICGRNGKRSNRTFREEVLRNLRSVVSLTFLLGMTWGFALFAWGPVYLLFTYLFTIFNSLQGLFIFIFHCALKENVQKQWRRYLCCGPYRLSENSDWSKTATNNTKKVSSAHLAKSLSSTSSTSSSWASKAKATLTPLSRRPRSAGESSQNSSKCVSSSSSDLEPNSSSSSILPVSQMIDKVKGYCSTRTDNFYKNIIMSDSFANCTRL